MAWPLGTSHPHSTLLLTASHIDNTLSSSKRVGNNCKVEQGITCQISESICLPGLRLLDSSSQGKCLIIPDCKLCLSLLCCHTCVDASWVSLHSGHGVVSQQCLALPVQREGFLFAVEITPYLSGSYEAADRLQIPVVKDNPLLTCPAPLVCSHTANVVPAGWGGSFFFFLLCSWQETRKWKVVWNWENCRNLAGDDFHLGNLSVPEGHLKWDLRRRGIRFSFQLVCLVIIVTIWHKLHSLALHLCRLNSYSWPSVLVNTDDRSQNAL